VLQQKKKQLHHVLHIVKRFDEGADVDDLLQMTEEQKEKLRNKKRETTKKRLPKSQKGDLIA